MNQKEYELIADILKLQREKWEILEEPVCLIALDHLIDTLAEKLQRTYPKTFNRNKFLKACGV